MKSNYVLVCQILFKAANKKSEKKHPHRRSADQGQQDQRICLNGNLFRGGLRRGGGHGRGVEGVHLIGAEAIFLEPHGQVHHVFIAGAGVGGDEVRDQELLLARFCAVFCRTAF